MNPRLPLVLATLAAFVTGLAVARLGDDDRVRQPIAAEIEAEVLVDATAVRMHGFDRDGNPGEWVYDCTHAEDPKPGEPSLICEQRAEG